MANVDRRAAMKVGLQKKTQESYEKRDDSGQFKSIFKEEFTSKLWKCEAGDHLIDIIPYPAGNNDPSTKPGEPTYVLILWVHYGIGVNQDAYVCPARNFSQPCPICEYREDVRRQEDYDEELVKELTPKRRSIYNITCYDNDKEENKGVQIFDAAHWFMEKHISSLSKIPTRGQGKSTDMYVAFSDPEEGKSIAFTRKGTKRNTEFLGHKFVDRNYVIPDEILDAAFILDECINYSSYEEIQVAFQGSGGDVAPAAEPAPQPAAAAPEGGGLRRRTASAPSAEPAPSPADSPAPSPAAAPAPALTPRSARAAAPAAPTCPVEGGTFGVDCEKFPECPNCELWNPCSEEADRMAAAAAPAPSAAAPAPRPSTPATPRPTPRPAAAAAPAARPATPAPAATPPAAGPRRGLRPRS